MPNELESTLISLIEQHIPTERELGKLLPKSIKQEIMASGRLLHTRLRILENAKAIYLHENGKYHLEPEYLF